MAKGGISTESKKDKNQPEEGMLSPVFVVGSISVQQMEGASCFNVGNNFPTNFQSYKKHNQGFGSIHGDHAVVPNLRSLLNDPDVLDTVSLQPDPEVPKWLQRLIEAENLPPEDLAKAFLAAGETEKKQIQQGEGKHHR
jgi:hypothetical protein